MGRFTKFLTISFDGYAISSLLYLYYYLNMGNIKGGKIMSFMIFFFQVQF